MHRRPRVLLVPVVSLTLMWLLAGCLPIPRLQGHLELPTPRYRMAPDAVLSDYFPVPGAREPHTPTNLDASYVLRLRADEPARAVLVLVPGLFGGAGSLEVLGRQLVAATPGLQVWLWDRRSNALEDHEGFALARASDDPDVALRYYLGTAGVPPRYHPPKPADIRFMAYWGLQVHLEDLAAVIERAHRTAATVYLGGHSLGASLVALYAAYILPDGRPGADTIAGLVLLDGAPGRTGTFALADAVEGRSLFGYPLVPSLPDLLSGKAVPYLGPGVVPQHIVRSDVIATLARMRPDALAPRRLVDYPITDFALAGVDADDTYSVLPTFTPQLGEAVGARFSGFIVPFLLEGSYGARSRSVVGVAPGVRAVTWSPGDPPQPTDLSTYIRSVTGAYTDRSEWYFPARLLIDISRLDVGLEHAAGFEPTADVRVPTLAVGAGKGMIRNLDGFAAYSDARLGSPIASYVVPGLTHIDLVTARAAPVVTLFQRWSGLPAAAVGVAARRRGG
ncbi:MAG TPA: hypothetical protein VKB31_02590 [Trueperaceae bacterium]|nr:hypothetical protein [Trueperaceae bacterium]